MSSNLLAHHLKVLQSAGLVRRAPSEADGRRSYVLLGARRLRGTRLNARAWDWLLMDVAGMDTTARVTETLRFFCYDTVKIALLLAGISSSSRSSPGSCSAG